MCGLRQTLSIADTLKCLENEESCWHLLANYLTTKNGMYVEGERKKREAWKEGREETERGTEK